jgi:hypothetical protein
VLTGVYLVGYDGGASPCGNSTYTLRGQQTGIQKGTSITVTAGATVAVASAVAGYGAYVQVIAAAASELLVQGLAVAGNVSAATEFHILEFATGAAGAEVVRARIPVLVLSLGGGAILMMPRPLLVKPGERLAVHAYSSAVKTFQYQFLYEQH